jgi:hypothetical protein
MATEMDQTMGEQPELDSEVNAKPQLVPLIDGGCRRCGGLMVAERYIDLLDDTGQIEFTAERCVQCGEVVDQTILANRLASQARVHAQLAQVA